VSGQKAGSEAKSSSGTKAEDSAKESSSESPRRELPSVSDQTTYHDLMDSRVAKIFATSKLVPAHFQGNLSDCIIACQMAMRLEIDPMMLMQKMYIINGKPGMEAQLVIALVNSRGPFNGPVQFRLEGEGKNRQCTAYATHKATGEVCSATVTWAMVEAEGWNKNKGSQISKWNTIPDQMFPYRSATFLARLYCPEVLMGLTVADELEDIGQTIDVTPEAAPLEIPMSVKEAESAEMGPPGEMVGGNEEAGSPGTEDDGAASSGGDIGPGEDRETEKAADVAGDLFGGEPGPDEAAEIAKAEKGGYGPP
jgi:hypothetical protein